MYALFEDDDPPKYILDAGGCASRRPWAAMHRPMLASGRLLQAGGAAGSTGSTIVGFPMLPLSLPLPTASCAAVETLHAQWWPASAPMVPPAGANAGFSTLLFKSLWPDATVVSLEPDPSNFDMLKRNTAG